MNNLRISVFFDGTGNNKWNDQLLNDGSISNIAKIHQLYDESGFITIYAEGVGTTKYTKDKAFTSTRINKILNGKDKNDFYDTRDLAFGSNAKKTIKKIILKVKKIISKNNNKLIKIDIYGFSRGSSQARDFINRINKYYSNIDNINIDFVGLFDTVASFGLAGPINIGYNLNLNDKSAKKIIHLVSKDEKRHNFPLESLYTKNKTIENNMQEIEENGVHADIGGGYSENDNTIDMIIENTEEIHLVAKNHQRLYLKYKEEQEQKAQELGGKLICSKLKKIPVIEGFNFKTIIIKRKNIKFGLSNKSLNTMYKKIRSHGIELVELDVLGETKQGNSNFLAPQNITEEYYHISSSSKQYDSSFTDKLANFQNIDAKRNIYFNEPLKSHN